MEEDHAGDFPHRDPDTESEDPASSDSEQESVEQEGAGIDPAHLAEMEEMEEEILDRLKRNHIDLDTFESRDDFLKRYMPLLEHTATSRPDQQNVDVYILHRIAKRRDLDVTKSAPLVRLLLREFPGLSKATDEDGKTALHVALSSKNMHIAQAIVDALAANDEIFSTRDEKGTHCVHLALMMAHIPNALILDLIRKAPKTAFRERDRQDLTPLHHAVHYSRCTTERLEIIEELLRKDDSVLDILSSQRLSPYQYHLETARQFTKERSAVGRQGLTTSLRSHIRFKHQFTEPSYDLTQIRDLEKGADKIRDTLKLWILRTRGEDEAKELLYGSEPKSKSPDTESYKMNESIQADSLGSLFQDIHLSLRLHRDPQEEPTTIPDFREVYESSTFDTVLSLVSLRDFRFQEGKQDGTPGSRNDAEHIFAWLELEKGVRRIINVSVKDLTIPYHTEQSIHRALSGFLVERLDWQRPDICPAVVRSVGDAVENLILYWGGNNAVLRGWSEPEGLPRLPKLKKIELIVLEVSRMIFCAVI